MLEHTAVPYLVEPVALPPRSPNEKMTTATSAEVGVTQTFDPYALVAARPNPPATSSSYSGPSAAASERVLEPLLAPRPEQSIEQDRSMRAEIATVPGLVDTLNRLLSRLPVGGEQGEQPPSYMEQ